MRLIRVGVDLATNVFQLHGVDRSEKTAWRRKLVRGDWIEELLESLEPGCEIRMEACSGAHYRATKLQAQEYTVKLLPFRYRNPAQSFRAFPRSNHHGPACAASPFFPSGLRRAVERHSLPNRLQRG